MSVTKLRSECGNLSAKFYLNFADHLHRGKHDSRAQFDLKRPNLVKTKRPIETYSCEGALAFHMPDTRRFCLFQ